MKSFKLLCLIALFWAFASSCSRIVTTDYEMTDHAIITSIDTSCHRLGLKSLENASEKNFIVSSAINDVLSFTDMHYSQQLHIGDTVFVYNTGQNYIASKVSIEDAKAVNRELSNYYWQNILSNWYWYVILAICMATFGWGYFLHASNKNMFITPILAGFIILWFACVLGGAGRLLHFVQEGTVTQISDNRLELNGNTLCCVASVKDFCSEDTLKVGDRVALYNYVDLDIDSSDFFASKRRLDDHTLTYWRIYPEITLMTIAWFLVLTLIVLTIFVYIRGVIEGIREG